MGRSKCANCETPVRGRRLCQMCEVTDYYGEGIEDQEETPTADASTREMREYECTVCGTEYETDGDRKCPDCGAQRYRYIGPLEGAA